MNRSTTPKRPAKENDQYREAVQRIATALGETNAQPLAHIRRIVRVLGEERAHQLLTQAQTVEQDGGLMTISGKRRRTLGGVFFRLTREQVSDEERARIWPPRPWPSKRTAGPTSSEDTPVPS